MRVQLVPQILAPAENKGKAALARPRDLEPGLPPEQRAYIEVLVARNHNGGVPAPRDGLDQAAAPKGEIGNEAAAGQLKQLENELRMPGKVAHNHLHLKQ